MNESTGKSRIESEPIGKSTLRNVAVFNNEKERNKDSKKYRKKEEIQMKKSREIWPIGIGVVKRAAFAVAVGVGLLTSAEGEEEPTGVERRRRGSCKWWWRRV